jgi:hypothetical protein
MDAFQAEVRDTFRAHGCAWVDTNTVGNGFPDALACWNGKLLLIEIKSGKRGVTTTKAKTAEAQRKFALNFPVRQVTTLQEATDTIQWFKHGSPGEARHGVTGLGASGPGLARSGGHDKAQRKTNTRKPQQPHRG